MITTNVLQRVFQIKVGVALGIGFSIDVKGKQYLVTASHVVGALSGTTEIELFHDGQWKSLGVTVIGRYNPDEIDVAVLGPHKPLTHPKFAMEPSCGVAYGQDVYFLGFPYGLAGSLGELNRNFPAPFVKKPWSHVCRLASVERKSSTWMVTITQGFRADLLYLRSQDRRSSRSQG